MKPLTWLLCLTGIYGAFLAALNFLNQIGADRYWPGALNLYLPQAMWAVPGLLLAVLIYRVDRFWIWLPLLCVLWVLGPVMGLRWSPFAAEAAPAGSRSLRVMTWNIKYGYHDLRPLIEELERRKPDLVLFQDAVGSMHGPLKEYFRDWQVRSSGQYVVASRYPLSQAEAHELPSWGHRDQSFLKCRMLVGPTPVSLYNVHLKTPRRGLNALRSIRGKRWSLAGAVQSFTRNVRLRQLQAASLLGYLKGERGAVLLTGDLNAPDASLACATLRDGGLYDAFAEGGAGYGYTYGHLLLRKRLSWLGLSWMRIDHIMPNSSFVTMSCFTGSGEASDHRPVIADLALKDPPSPAGTNPLRR